MKPVSIALFAGMVACAFMQSASIADAVTYRERVLYSFTGSGDGGNPYSGVVDVGAMLYGTTMDYGGTVYSLDLNTRTENTLAYFRDTFYDPPMYVNGLLYGTTGGGYGEGKYDNNNEGTAFTLDPVTDAETVLYSFCSQANCTDGAGPNGPLLLMPPPSAHALGDSGILYGTTGAGGSPAYPLEVCQYGPGCGTVFSLNAGTGVEKVLYSFCTQPNCTDGAGPGSALISLKGVLYGTTLNGGVANCLDSDGCGMAFSFDPSSGAERTVYVFCSQPNCADGGSPAGLIAVNGLLYGTTYQGGDDTVCPYGCGTVFSIDPTTGVETVLHAFTGGADGAGPIAGLIYGNGTLYGTTLDGGPGGTVFSVNPATGVETTLYAFCSLPNCRDGNAPNQLIYVNGKLYGTTTFGGGSGDYGTVFVLEPER